MACVHLWKWKVQYYLEYNVDHNKTVFCSPISTIGNILDVIAHINDPTFFQGAIYFKSSPSNCTNNNLKVLKISSGLFSYQILQEKQTRHNSAFVSNGLLQWNIGYVYIQIN